MAATYAGLLLTRVLAIDAALQMRMHVTLADVTSEEFAALHLLMVGRGKKQEEDFKEEERREARKPK